ncbi:hypothetical protein NQ314_019630 [Rhamnusium bicolor]|uniref:Uncharacterized protein n=1 Tax=Rhamnusium bicolor TaxID=1586634 RepID=A0AAV8WN33_9CUCU|nr:hypothetical protein NQ314_019630 [Rhamnusium bicolor]
MYSLDCPEFKVENNVPPSGDIDCYYVPDPNYISMESASNTNLDEAESAEDEFDIFGRYIASELRKIKSEEHRNEIKRKILQIIIDITAQNENLGDADLE